MSSVKTSAGDSLPAPTSIATLWRPPPRHDRHQFGERPLGERDVSGFAGQRHGVAAHMQIRGQEAFESAQVFVGGTEQAHDEIGRNIDAAANRRYRRTSSVGFAGRHVRPNACFLWCIQRVSLLKSTAARLTNPMVSHYAPPDR